MALVPLNRLIRNSDAGNADDAAAPDNARSSAPLGGTRSEAIQRVQFGVGGLIAMVLLVGIANIVIDSARETEATTVPNAAATAKAEPTQNDPLVDAGIVPDLPAEATEEPLPEGPVVPETGEGLPPAE